MEQEEKQLFIEYARLKTEAAAIKERLDELNPVLVGKLMAIAGYDTKLETSIGNFTVKKTSVWTWPQAIIDAESAIKVAKETAKKTGDATSEITPSVSFRRKPATSV